MKQFLALMCIVGIFHSHAAYAMSFPGCEFLRVKMIERNIASPSFYEKMTEAEFKDALVALENRLKFIKSDIRGANELAYLTELNVRMVDLIRHDIKANDLSDVISTLNPTFLNVEFGFAYVREGRKIQDAAGKLLEKKPGEAP